jgi:hypothetical protein
VPLDVVELSSSDAISVFTTSGRQLVSDSSASIPFARTWGSVSLQSRTSEAGEQNLPASGLFPYRYRVIIQGDGGASPISCVQRVTIPFPGLQSIDYDGNGTAEQVYVVTQGALGSIRVVSAHRSGDRVTLVFEPGLCNDSSGRTVSSYFVGLTSAFPAAPATARLETTGQGLVLDARAPARPLE